MSTQLHIMERAMQEIRSIVIRKGPIEIHLDPSSSKKDEMVVMIVSSDVERVLGASADMVEAFGRCAFIEPVRGADGRWYTFGHIGESNDKHNG